MNWGMTLEINDNKQETTRLEEAEEENGDL